VRKAGVVAFVVCAFVIWSPRLAGAASTIPSAPRSVRMLPGNGRATVRWHKPANTGGRPITQYEVIPYLDNSPLPTNVFSSTATSEVIFGLTNGKSYTFKVAAKNSVGWSRLSARSGFVTIGVPLAPAAPTVVSGKARATVSWRAPPSDNGSAVISYRVTPFLDGAAQAAHTYKATPTHQVITGLQGGQKYTFQVEAHNRNGWSVPSNPSSAIVIGK
jgi:large repetitive protein